MTEEIKKKRGCLKAFLIGLAIVILVPVILIGSCQLKYYINKNATGKRVVQLLNKTYNDKFAIARGEYVWATGAYQFAAYPVNEPTFKFMVLISSMTSSGISTTYLLDRRIYDLMKQVKPYVCALTAKNFFYANSGSGIGMNLTETQEFLNYAGKNKIISNDVLLKRYPYKLGTSTGITYCYEVTDESKEQIAKDIYNLLCFYREKKFGVIDISAAFYNVNLFDDAGFKKEAKSDPSSTVYGGKLEDIHSMKFSYKYRASYNLNILERYNPAKKAYMPTRNGDDGTFTDTNRIITDYKDIKKQIRNLNQ